jgi:RimJ/RimL family protein N-acetyltransferase
MSTTIETERLILEPLTLDHLDEVVEMHATPEIERWMGTFGRAQARERLERNQREWDEHGYGLMAILERSSGRFLGRSGLKYWPQFDETEVGWVLRVDVWGHGFATEAGRACPQWGFGALGVPYLTALIQPENLASIGVAERLAMHPLRPDRLGDIPVTVYWRERDVASSHQEP